MKDKLQNLIAKIGALFDFKNPYLRKSRIFCFIMILLLIIGIFITGMNNNKVGQLKQQLQQPNVIKNEVNDNHFNNTVKENNPYNKSEFKQAVTDGKGEEYASKIAGTDGNRTYILSMMMNNPSFKEKKPDSKDDPTLKLLNDYANQNKINQNLFEKGVCLTAGGFQWYVENQFAQDYNLIDTSLGFDEYNSTVYSNQPLNDDLQQRLKQIYRCCELVTVKPDLQFKVVNNQQ